MIVLNIQNAFAFDWIIWFLKKKTCEVFSIMLLLCPFYTEDTEAQKGHVACQVWRALKLGHPSPHLFVHFF